MTVSTAQDLRPAARRARRGCSGCGGGAAAPIPARTPHDLRHTAASLAISAGAKVKAVQRMLGHASAAMTLDTYADLFDDDLDSVSGALNTTATAIGAMGSFLRRDPQDPPPLDAESR
ncbi:hypothetical protein GCM10009758_17060 [Microbacterium hatanonis]